MLRVAQPLRARTRIAGALYPDPSTSANTSEEPPAVGAPSKSEHRTSESLSEQEWNVIKHQDRNWNFPELLVDIYFAE